MFERFVWIAYYNGFKLIIQESGSWRPTCRFEALCHEKRWSRESILRILNTVHYCAQDWNRFSLVCLTNFYDPSLHACLVLCPFVFRYLRCYGDLFVTTFGLFGNAWNTYSTTTMKCCVRSHLRSVNFRHKLYDDRFWNQPIEVVSYMVENGRLMTSLAQNLVAELN